MQRKREKRHSKVIVPVLLAGGLAVLLLGGAALQAGRGALGARLTDISGDAAALQGFALNGVTTDGTAGNTFVLHDGVMQNTVNINYVPGDVMHDEQRGSYSLIDVIAPEQRDAVNAAATVQAWSGGTGLGCDSKATEFWRMLEITADNKQENLRVQVGTVTTQAPTDVNAHVQLTEGGIFNDYQTYINVDTQPGAGSVKHFSQDQKLYFCWQLSTSLLPAGLYRVAESLSAEEIAALPRDGKLGELDILCGTTPYGKLELFYQPADAVRVLEWFDLGKEGMAVYCQQEDGTLRVDLVNPSGECTDQKVLAQSSLDHYFGISQFPRQRQNEVSIACDDYPPNTQRAFQENFAALRAEGGKFILSKIVKRAGDLSVSNSAAAPVAMLVNAQGTAVMLVEKGTTKTRFHDFDEGFYQNGYTIEILPVTGDAPLYTGWLDTGDTRVWGMDLQASGGYVYNVLSYAAQPSHVTQFPNSELKEGAKA